MTWIYFDESGEHQAGRLKRLTLGGCIASGDQWTALDAAWKVVLSKAGIPMFHMSDFEARRGPFEGWSDEKRREVLSSLLGIMENNIPRYWGVSDFLDDIEGAGEFRAAYEKNVVQAFMQIIRNSDSFSDGDINIVFARHKDISSQWIDKFFDIFSYWMPGRLKFGGFGDPISLPQLQAADIIAYEFSRTARKDRPENERYPLIRLAENAQEFTLYHASRLGLNHYEWGRKPLLRRQLEQ